MPKSHFVVGGTCSGTSALMLSMATRKTLAKVRGVYEREPRSGIWWICYKQGSVRKRGKVGRRTDAIALYQQRKTELLAGAKLVQNLRHHGVNFGELADDALAWSEEFHPKGIRTVKGRMKVVKDEFGAMLAAELTPWDDRRLAH